MTSPARTPLTPLMVATVFVLVVSVAGQVIGGRQGSVGMSLFAGMAFVGAMLRVSWILNRPWWQCATTTELGPGLMDGRPMTAAQNARLLALGYAWGGASLLAVYMLSGLRWQHGWQYGSGMLAIAALVYLYAQGLATRWTPLLDKRLMAVSILHGWAATGGLAWLILTGKIWSLKDDWAANVVFACGAIVLVGVSAIAVRTARLLAQQACLVPDPDP